MVDSPVKVYGRAARLEEMLRLLRHADELHISDITVDMMYTILVND